mgnify:CR=1 FL=1
MGNYGEVSQQSYRNALEYLDLVKEANQPAPDKIIYVANELTRGVYNEVKYLDDIVSENSDQEISFSVNSVVKRYSFTDPVKALSELLNILGKVQESMDNISMVKLELMDLKGQKINEGDRSKVNTKITNRITYVSQCFFHVKSKFDYIKDVIETIRSINTTSRSYKYSNREISGMASQAGS